MKKINFTKMVASGNDFVLIDSSLRSIVPALPVGRHGPQALARKMCDRKFGAGADGLLLLERSKIAYIKMRIINADGSEAEMCGNGARCVALYISRQSTVHSLQPDYSIQTKAGIILSEVQGDRVKIKLTNPRGLKLDIPLKINNRPLKASFINTGVPHAVVFVEGLGKIDVVGIGRQIRYHRRFAPAGTNVNFVEVLSSGAIAVRTYERGVEDETLACGTGSVASSLLYAIRNTQYAMREIKVHTKSKEILKVYFKQDDGNLHDVWLQGQARIVYAGGYYV